MNRAYPWCAAGALVATALALAGCSSGDNPVLSSGVVGPDAANRGMLIPPDAAPLEVQVGSDARDAGADTTIANDASENDAPVINGSGYDGAGYDGAYDAGPVVDVALPPIVTVTILWPTAGSPDGGADDGGAQIPVISNNSRFAPKVSVVVQNRGGDPTTEALGKVTAKVIEPKSQGIAASVQLNQVQYIGAPDSGSKTYIFSDTPINIGAVSAGFFTLEVDAPTLGGTTGIGTVPIYIDRGPVVTVLQPADNACAKGSLIVTAVISDAQAGIASVTFSVGQHDLDPASISSSSGLYTVTIDFGSFDPPLDGQQQLTITAVNGNNVPTVQVLNFMVDNTGPSITPSAPANTPTTIIGGITTLSVSVRDQGCSSVMPDSVVAVVANGGIHFDVVLKKGDGDTYQNIFDTSLLPPYTLFPSISFRAQDLLGNQSSIGYLVGLDNTPPIIDLDPPATFRLFRKSDGKCSWPFDPVGPDAIDDGAMVTQLFDIRARIEDQGNTPLTGYADYVPISMVNPATVKVLILDDTSRPLVVDTSNPPDGICDDINPELIPSVSPQSSQEAQLLDMVTLPAGGAGDFTPEPGSSCAGADGNPPNPLCITTYSEPKNKYMTYSLDYNDAHQPAIWTVPPLDTGSDLKCAGRQFDASNNLKDGWACIAAVASDFAGNKQVSRPIRVCVTATPGSTACEPAAVGGATITSVTLPATGAGQVSVVTSAPMLDAAGSPIQVGDGVVLSNIGPLAIARIGGTHPVTSIDSTGTSFTFDDLSIAPVALSIDNGDGKDPTPVGMVGLVLQEGVAPHVVTTASTTLAGQTPPPASILILLSNFAVEGKSKWTATNIQPDGFDLLAGPAELSGTAIPASRLPDCTGTVIKQASGAAPAVDATKPCKPWASFPPFEGLEI